MRVMTDPPVHLDLNRRHGLTIEWADGRRNHFSVDYLRMMSPSAETRKLREEMAKNPLAVLPAGMANRTEPLEAAGAELVGNYAVRIRFSDGHDTGIYSWSYLREIDRGEPGKGAATTQSEPAS